PDKSAAFREAFRALRPGGRLVVSDMVTRGPLPHSIRSDPAAWAACIAGAVDLDDYLAMIRAAGFERVETVTSTPGAPGQVFSATVRAIKPDRKILPAEVDSIHLGMFQHLLAPALHPDRALLEAAPQVRKA